MISHGAITVINAIPCGIGAAVGIDLVTKAEFKTAGIGREVRIINDIHEDTAMAEICVRRTFEHFGAEEPEGWSLSVNSQIPISRGLKSSSSACNAIISSVSEFILKEGGRKPAKKEKIDMIRLGVRCAKEANVTVTGAFDDACACGLGGLVITDNTKDEILHRSRAERNDVILYVPKMKIRKPSLSVERFRAFADTAGSLVEIAKNDWYDALTKNGEMVASVLNIDNEIAKRAMSMGALAAGVSGTGPAVSVVVGKGEGRSFLKDLRHPGYETILTRTR